jgi:hypothetical protein
LQLYREGKIYWKQYKEQIHRVILDIFFQQLSGLLLLLLENGNSYHPNVASNWNALVITTFTTLSLRFHA